MECELKWALFYHLAKMGEYESGPLSLQVAWRLKHMKNIFLLFGELVHQIIEAEINTLLETGEVLSEVKIKKRLSNMLNQTYIRSKKGLNQWYKEPKANPLLYEVYYDGSLSDSTIQFIKQRMDNCIKGIIHSATINDLIAKGNVRIMEAEKYRSFYLDGVRVVLSADLIYFDEDNDEWGLVDWKTGKWSKDDILQLAIYALYLEKNYGANLSDIIVTNEYLESRESKSYMLDTYQIDNLRDTIEQSAKRMNELEMNLHKPVDEIINVFQKTDDKERCERCNFKAICLESYRDVHLGKFLKSIRKNERAIEVKVPNIEMMRELVSSGMPVDNILEEFLEESVNPTEESYQSKLEQISEYLLEY
jgi:CRISPR/Cas system-associated exonuclease Cas4 (RecB family)